MSSDQIRSARVPQEASSEDVARLIAAMDRTTLALCEMSVSRLPDGTFVLNIPLALFAVSAPEHPQPQDAESIERHWASAGQAQAQELSPLSSLNVGPTPAEVAHGLLQYEGSDEVAGSWYVVTRGLDVGVFKHFDQVMHLTSHVSGGAQKKHGSQTLALEAYTRAWNAGVVRRV